MKRLRKSVLIGLCMLLVSGCTRRESRTMGLLRDKVGDIGCKAVSYSESKVDHGKLRTYTTCLTFTVGEPIYVVILKEGQQVLQPVFVPGEQYTVQARFQYGRKAMEPSVIDPDWRLGYPATSFIPESRVDSLPDPKPIRMESEAYRSLLVKVRERQLREEELRRAREAREAEACRQQEAREAERRQREAAERKKAEEAALVQKWNKIVNERVRSAGYEMTFTVTRCVKEEILPNEKWFATLEGTASEPYVKVEGSGTQWTDNDTKVKGLPHLTILKVIRPAGEKHTYQWSSHGSQWKIKSDCEGEPISTVGSRRDVRVIIGTPAYAKLKVYLDRLIAVQRRIEADRVRIRELSSEIREARKTKNKLFKNLGLEKRLHDESDACTNRRSRNERALRNAVRELDSRLKSYAGKVLPDGVDLPPATFGEP